MLYTNYYFITKNIKLYKGETDREATKAPTIE